MSTKQKIILRRFRDGDSERNIWPVIIPVTRDSGTAYYLLIFDRDSWTGPRTYGNIHWYYAEEFANGFLEYEKPE